jgi:hypothetical protein
MDYPWPRVCIPTYERYLTLGGATLRYLHSIGYPREKIILFVASDDQARLYRDWVEEHLYGQIVVGVLGLVQQRNFITKWLSSDEIFISMDDDVQIVKVMTGFNIYWIIADAITKLKTNDYGLAGIMPNSDARRFKTGFTMHLAHIVGSFYICKNNHSLLLDCDPVIQEAKEDIYRSLQYFIVYGRILRYRSAGVQTVYRNPNGGIAAEGRRERDAFACLDLIRRYPKFVKHIDKKSGWPDVLLRWRARNTDI